MKNLINFFEFSPIANFSEPEKEFLASNLALKIDFIAIDFIKMIS